MAAIAPTNVRFTSRPLVRYASALVAVGLAFLLRRVLAGSFSPGLTYITFYPAVMLAATLGGLGPGLLATAASAVLVAVWIIPWPGQFQGISTPDALGLGLFSTLGAVMSLVSELYHRTRHKLAEQEMRRAAEEALRDSQRQNEQELYKVNRTLKALKNSTSAMIRTTSEPDYLKEVCKIVVEDCGHAMVWVGFAEDDEAKTIRPVAHAGFEAGYLENLKLTWADSEFGRGTAGTAIRSGLPQSCKNMQTDPRFAPWREEVTRRGYASVLVFPLLANGRAFGVLVIYSRQLDAFSEDETHLLGDLAGGLAYGITALRLRSATDQAEEALQRANQELEQRIAQRTIEARQNEARYRSLVTATAQIVWVTNAQGQVAGELPTWQEFTGQTSDQYGGSGWTDALHPEDRERTTAVWARALATRTLYLTEYRLRRHDGEYRDVAVRGVPVLDDHGVIREWVGACTDITARKEAERRREFTSALLALFAQKTSVKEYLDAVVEVIRQWSGCQALGIRLIDEHREIPYESWAGFAPGFIELERRMSLLRDNCCCTRALMQAYEDHDRSFLTPGGSYRCNDTLAFFNQLPPEKRERYRGNCMKFGFASLAVIPIYYREATIGAVHLADARPGRFALATIEFIEAMTPLIGEAVHRFQAEAELAKYRDHLEESVRQRTGELEAANDRLQVEIAERQRAQETLLQITRDLERSNRDLEQFAYVASHDLQEPLRAVGGYVKLLQRRFPDRLDAKATEYITGAVEGANRMERLIADLLAYSRLDSRGGNFVATDLNALLADALSNLQTSIKDAQATITTKPLPTLTVDATQLVQLFQNLVGNALKFRSDRTPEIQVDAQHHDDQWVISVRDNGIGIDPQYFERIFHIFQRLHTRTHYPGTGIGLAVCKKIVERHGGAIWVESRLGQGSTFYFSIPELPAIRESSV